jgi:PAS domain S-box-containing protein
MQKNKPKPLEIRLIAGVVLVNLLLIGVVVAFFVENRNHQGRPAPADWTFGKISAPPTLVAGAGLGLFLLGSALFTWRSLRRLRHHLAVDQAQLEELTLLRVLTDQSRDGIVILDQTGKVWKANKSFAEMLGYTAEETAALHVWDWDAMLSREDLIQAIDKVGVAGDHFESRHRRKDGTVFPVEISTNAVVTGGRKLIFCICRDLSERHHATAALARKEALLQAILRDLPFDFWVRDANGRMVAQSAESIKFWGDLVANPETDLPSSATARWPDSGGTTTGGSWPAR